MHAWRPLDGAFKLFLWVMSCRFLLQFQPAGQDQGCSQLQVVETNPFRHLTHLQLKLVPASDICLKKYLADCLLSLKVSTCAFSELLTMYVSVYVHVYLLGGD